MKNTQKVVISAEKALEDIMAIIEGTGSPTVKEKKVDKPVEKKTAAPTIVYENGRAVEVNGKKTTTGPKKKGGKRAPKNDPGREKLKSLVKDAISSTFSSNSNIFEHSSEGLVISMSEADYTIKVSKSKEAKYNVKDPDFKVEKDFTTRGKAVNRAPGIAKAIIAALINPNTNIPHDLCVAKSSGITLQIEEGEYTIKISKKRDRVGFEAEKAAAYN
jgi:hypothetical protein